MTLKKSFFLSILLSALSLQGQEDSLPWATYEAGPGYSYPNSITREQEEIEARTMKSLASGTATLDAFLYRSTLGFKLQNYFIFGRKRHYWASHAPLNQGGAASPPWLGMTLYNNYGVGDFLKVNTIETPTMLKAKTRQRRQEVDLPLIGVYATRDHDRVNLSVLSRKVPDYPNQGDDGYTPVKVDLPFNSAEKVTVYRMTGNASDNNLDSEVVQIDERFLGDGFRGGVLPVNQNTGGSEAGMPPASTFLYVFEGVNLSVRSKQAMISSTNHYAHQAYI